MFSCWGVHEIRCTGGRWLNEKHGPPDLFPEEKYGFYRNFNWLKVFPMPTKSINWKIKPFRLWLTWLFLPVSDEPKWRSGGYRHGLKWWPELHVQQDVQRIGTAPESVQSAAFSLTSVPGHEAAVRQRRLCQAGMFQVDSMYKKTWSEISETRKFDVQNRSVMFRIHNWTSESDASSIESFVGVRKSNSGVGESFTSD